MAFHIACACSLHSKIGSFVRHDFHSTASMTLNSRLGQDLERLLKRLDFCLPLLVSLLEADSGLDALGQQRLLSVLGAALEVFLGKLQVVLCFRKRCGETGDFTL